MKPDLSAIIRTSVEAGAEAGATKALMAIKALSDTITLAECKTLYGRALASKMRLSPKIKWLPVGKGSKTSGVFAKRNDVSMFILSKKLEDCTI